MKTKIIVNSRVRLECMKNYGNSYKSHIRGKRFVLKICQSCKYSPVFIGDGKLGEELLARDLERRQHFVLYFF